MPVRPVTRPKQVRGALTEAGLLYAFQPGPSASPRAGARGQMASSAIEDRRKCDQRSRAQLRSACDRVQRRRRLCRRRCRPYLVQPQDARPLEEVTTRLLADQARVSDLDRRGASAGRAGARQARPGPRRDRGHDPDLHRPDRPGRPARRPHGRLRRGDGAGPEGLVDSIETIANKTNMLRPNATIEAARAGDAGRSLRWSPPK